MASHFQMRKELKVKMITAKRPEITFELIYLNLHVHMLARLIRLVFEWENFPINKNSSRREESITSHFL